MIVKALQSMVTGAHKRSCERCNDWSGKRVAAARPQALLDVGTGDGSFLFHYLDYKPQLFCGVEAAPELKKRAAERGLQMSSFDLNGVWPYETNTFDVVHCSQVIEHLHNTRLFGEEILRVLKPGGSAFITSENLASLLNTGAMLFGYTPFTLMRCCGWFLGNPMGLHAGEHVPEGVPITDPAFAGVTGHVRALTVIQAQELFEKIGFVNVKVSSMGLMPLPDWMGMRLEGLMYRRGHLLLLEAQKPQTKA
ncbi:MAG TPA: class I SAM-dependent methyltransferase [Candidatus Acidoferrum sp.]|nr:class I SAM-dependent methyltransferase [Candidatus Acidoferrum sp.]